jgi:hypothetical protein
MLLLTLVPEYGEGKCGILWKHTIVNNAAPLSVALIPGLGYQNPTTF